MTEQGKQTSQGTVNQVYAQTEPLPEVVSKLSLMEQGRHTSQGTVNQV